MASRNECRKIGEFRRRWLARTRVPASRSFHGCAASRRWNSTAPGAVVCEVSSSAVRICPASASTCQRASASMVEAEGGQERQDARSDSASRAISVATPEGAAATPPWRRHSATYRTVSDVSPAQRSSIAVTACVPSSRPIRVRSLASVSSASRMRSAWPSKARKRSLSTESRASSAANACWACVLCRLAGGASVAGEPSAAARASSRYRSDNASRSGAFRRSGQSANVSAV